MQVQTHMDIWFLQLLEPYRNINLCSMPPENSPSTMTNNLPFSPVAGLVNTMCCRSSIYGYTTTLASAYLTEVSHMLCLARNSKLAIAWRSDRENTTNTCKTTDAMIVISINEKREKSVFTPILVYEAPIYPGNTMRPLQYIRIQLSRGQNNSGQHSACIFFGAWQGIAYFMV